MVKNLLEIEGIASFLKDDISGTKNPIWKPGAEVRVMMCSMVYEKARQVAVEYRKTQNCG